MVAVGAKQCPAVHEVGDVDRIDGLDERPQETTHDIPVISRHHGHEAWHFLHFRCRNLSVCTL